MTRDIAREPCLVHRDPERRISHVQDHRHHRSRQRLPRSTCPEARCNDLGIFPAPQGRGTARPENHVIVLFAATGDLARRKLLPGLFHPEARDQGSLAAAGVMPDRYRIIGSSRRSLTDEQFREHARQAIAEFGSTEPAGAAWEAFQRRLSFVSADPVHTFPLVEAIARAEQQIGGAPGRLFHLAVPPAAFEPTVTMLGGELGGSRAPSFPAPRYIQSSTALDDPGVGSRSLPPRR
jgi:Glucose-6-phosphate dehydrogenase, NAD binding domain